MMHCDFCGSTRGVKEFRFPPDPPIVLCRVCSRLRVASPVTPKDVLYAVVSLFHALDLLPHDSDDEEEE